jgi:hypothetical protein
MNPKAQATPFHNRVSQFCERFAHVWTVERKNFVRVANEFGLEPDSDQLVEALVERGWAYGALDDVYFPPDPNPDVPVPQVARPLVKAKHGGGMQ